MIRIKYFNSEGDISENESANISR